MARVINIVLSLSLLAGSAVQAQTADTTTKEKPKPLFVVKDLAVAAAFAAGTVALAPLDRHVTIQLQKPARQSNRILKTSATVFRLLGEPGGLITATGIYLIGRADGQQKTQELGLHTMAAIALSGGEAGAIKMIAGRARPYASLDNARNFGFLRGLKDDKYRSFPSGHTTSAFAFAAAVSGETQRWWPSTRWIIGPILYSGATLTGMSRIYNEAHWASDVMAGAALGTITGAKMVRYEHTHPKNWLDRKFLKMGVSVVNGVGWVPIVSTVSY
ncbi:MAG: phosphatase PAP2 family protein [Gemmatimonadaceae bacterium]